MNQYSLEHAPRIKLTKEQVVEVRNISHGVFAPLRGFLKKDDFERVVSEMRLKDGEIWPIPIVLDLNERNAQKINNKDTVLLVDEQGQHIALLKDTEVYSYDKERFAQYVFGTLDKEHPGVEAVGKMGPYLVGGEIEMLSDDRNPFPEYNRTPAEVRDIFQKRGWRKIVAFQTRNVPHRGHEFLQKYALEHVDGLLIQPVIGEKKIGDFKDEYILSTYEILIDTYYPKDKILLSILPIRMRYAGPREAVFHALIRKNFGCTHFIVGRDHAGVGSYYSPFAAQEIFDQFSPDELGITILKYPEVVYCPVEKQHVFVIDCSHKERISFSGTRLREYVESKETPPTYLIRPEVYNHLIHSMNALVDSMYKNQTQQQGFVLWFTGLSQAGKTSTADEVFKQLRERGVKLERLDGDVIREHLSRDLGFSKEDRDENIKRVGFVASLLSRNGVGVVASFISPYHKHREGVKDTVTNFVEIYCNCPLEVCESRDTKGMYKKAREGTIKNFTGISDIYEEPKHPDVELHTDRETVQECAGRVINYIEERKFI